MRSRHLIMILAVVVPALALASAVHAAGMTGQTVQKQKVVGSYRLLLKIGPAEMMGSGGEMSMGGHAAMCMMKKHMDAPSVHAMHMNTCNHHVELHVYGKKSGKVIRNARVSITMSDPAMHMMIMVPIMTMESGGNTADFHYGNNVYAAPGMYTVLVHVNKSQTSFAVHLM